MGDEVMTDKLKELVAQWPHEYYDRKGRRHDALIPETGWVHADELCRRCLVETLLAEQAPAGEFDARAVEVLVAKYVTTLTASHPRWNNLYEFAEDIRNRAYAAGQSSQSAEPRDPAGK
jgi:hypothetical protein